MITFNVHATTGETIEWCDTEQDARQWILDHGQPGDFVLPFDPEEHS